jgi:hypothetical protein
MTLLLALGMTLRLKPAVGDVRTYQVRMKQFSGSSTRSSTAVLGLRIACRAIKRDRVTLEAAYTYREGSSDSESSSFIVDAQILGGTPFKWTLTPRNELLAVDREDMAIVPVPWMPTFPDGGLKVGMTWKLPAGSFGVAAATTGEVESMDATQVELSVSDREKSVEGTFRFELKTGLLIRGSLSTLVTKSSGSTSRTTITVEPQSPPQKS